MSRIRELQFILTYQPKQDKPYKIVVRQLHASTAIDEIRSALLKNGVRNIINVKHRVSKEPLPLFFIDLELINNKKSAYELCDLLNTRISVEPPVKKNTIPQCARCQTLGHTKFYCLRPYGGVKCGMQHDTKECTKSCDTLTKFMNLGGVHHANYKRCLEYKEI